MRRILVAVDFTDTTSEVVRWGAELARALHRQLVIVNVAEPVPDWALSMGEGPIPSIPSRTDYTERDMESRHAALLGIKERLTDEDFEVDVRVLRGRSADEITRAMDEFKPYMIVIGSHRRGALQHLFGRNVGSKVVRKAPCPVVVVHPDDHPEEPGTTGSTA